jgi:hypothetical protein
VLYLLPQKLEAYEKYYDKEKVTLEITEIPEVDEPKAIE